MNNAERNYIVDKALEDVHVVNPAKSREELKLNEQPCKVPSSIA